MERQKERVREAREAENRAGGELAKKEAEASRLSASLEQWEGEVARLIQRCGADFSACCASSAVWLFALLVDDTQLPVAFVKCVA